MASDEAAAAENDHLPVGHAWNPSVFSSRTGTAALEPGGERFEDLTPQGKLHLRPHSPRVCPGVAGYLQRAKGYGGPLFSIVDSCRPGLRCPRDRVDFRHPVRLAHHHRRRSRPIAAPTRPPEDPMTTEAQTSPSTEIQFSRWPPGTALFCIPFYALPVALGVQVPSLDVDMLAKLMGSVLTAASAVFIYLCLRRFASRRGATWMTIAYALGTAAFHISGQDTWAHGPAQFCLAAVLYIALGETRRRGWHVLAGFLIGLMVTARPESVALVLPLLLWIAYRNGILIWVSGTRWVDCCRPSSCSATTCTTSAPRDFGGYEEDHRRRLESPTGFPRHCSVCSSAPIAAR